MAAILAEIRAGKLADELKREQADGYVRLERARSEAKALPVEQALQRLKSGRPPRER